MIPNNPKYIQAALIQTIVLRYFEQQYEGKEINIYGEIVNDIDIFTKQLPYLKGEICTFLTDLKNSDIDYIESIEVKHETPKNFRLKDITQILSKCAYSDITRLKLVIVPTHYEIEEVEDLKQCQQLKEQILKNIKNEDDKITLIKYLTRKEQRQNSIFLALSTCSNSWNSVKKQMATKESDFDKQTMLMMFDNFIALDYVVLEYDFLKKNVKFNQDFIFDLYAKLDI